jgi:hypothetical protein
MLRLSVVMAALLAVASARADLSTARAEPNLEKRSRLALGNADAAFAAAREAYRSGDLTHTQAALEEVRESVVLAHESLKQTGKNPSRSPKHFKHAEIKTRALLRRMDDFRNEMSFDDRPPLDAVRTVIDKINQELLRGIMGGRKR